MIPMVKAHSHDMRLTRTGAAVGCVAGEIGNFLFFAPHTSGAPAHVKVSCD